MPYPFTFTTYRDLLESLRRAGYVSGRFPDARKMLEAGERFVLLRHDVDFDVTACLQVARLDADAGYSSTFFFLLGSPHYNLFCPEASQIVRRILARGHRIGLHFDCANYPPDASVSELAGACRREVEILERWFQVGIEAVSYHRPSARVMTGDVELSRPYPHTYESLYIKDIYYCSDSRGEWRFGFPLDSEAFRAGRPMHLLLHPIWWREHDQFPIDKLRTYFSSQVQQLEHSLARNCAVYKSLECLP